MSWHHYAQLARRNGYGHKVTVPKDHVSGIPPGFEQSSLALPNGATAVYREDKPVDSLQIREFADHYTVELDRFNPKYRPLRHAAADATGYTALGLVALAAVAGGSG